MIQLQHIYKNFGKKVLYENLSATFPDRGLVVITGESGCGKTTLLRMIAGLDRKYTGKIERGNLNRIAYAFQESRLLPASDATENVALPLGNTQKAKEQAVFWLKAFGLEEDLSSYPDEMSGGMKQRVSLARAFAFSGDLLILDEPFNGIDAERIQSILKAIDEYAKEHLCLLVTHNLELLEKLEYEIFSIH